MEFDEFKPAARRYWFLGLLFLVLFVLALLKAQNIYTHDMKDYLVTSRLSHLIESAGLPVPRPVLLGFDRRSRVFTKSGRLRY